MGFLLQTSHGFLFKAILFACFLPSFHLLLALPSPESPLMPRIWHALDRLFEAQALAFLLVNCVTLTIIASSKLGKEKVGHGETEYSLGQGAGLRLTEQKGDKSGDYAVGNAYIGQSPCLDTPVKDGPEKLRDNGTRSNAPPSFCLLTPLIKDGRNFQKRFKGENFLRKSWSLNAGFEKYKPKHEENKLYHVKEEKPIIRSRSRLASRKNGKIRLPSNKSLKYRDLQKTQVTIASLSHAAKSEETLLEKLVGGQHCTKRHAGCTGNVSDFGPELQLVETPDSAGTAAAHPSLDKVWATINMPAQAPATTGLDHSAAAASHTLVVRPPACSGKRAAKTESCLAKAAQAAAPEKNGQDGNICNAREEANDDELEELNRRADEFIKRFNRRMRLQREESLQERQMTRWRRPQWRATALIP